MEYLPGHQFETSNNYVDVMLCIALDMISTEALRKQWPANSAQQKPQLSQKCVQYTW